MRLYKIEIIFLLIGLAFTPALHAQNEWATAFDAAQSMYDKGDAEGAYREALRSQDLYRKAGGAADANYGAILRVLALACYSLEKWEEGTETVGREIQVRTASPDDYLSGALLLRSQFLRTQGKYTAAVTDLETAATVLEKFPDQAESLMETRLELAGTLYLAGQSARSYALFNQVIPTVSILSEPIIQSYYYYGLLALDAGMPQAAIANLDKIRTSAPAAGLDKNEAFVALLGVLGDCYTLAGQWPQAVKVYQEAIAIDQTIGQAPSPATESIRAGLIAALVRQGQLSEARAMLRQIEKSGGSRTGVATGYARMAAARLEQHQADSAVQYLEYSLRLLDVSQAENQGLLADITRTLAQAEMERKREQVASKWLDQSLTAARRSGNGAKVLMAINRTATLNIKVGQVMKAEPLVKEAAGRIRQGAVPASEKAQALVNLGWLRQYYSDVVRSDSAFQAAVSIVTSDKSLSPAFVANVRGQYAACLQQRGDAASAYREMAAARTSLSRIVPPDVAGWTTLTGNMADLNIRMGKTMPAQVLLDSALLRIKPDAEKYPTEYAGLLLTQAKLLQVMGAYTRSEQAGAQLIVMLRAKKNTDPMLLVLALDQQANAYKAMGNFEAAEPLLKSAMDEMEKGGLTSSPTFTTILQNLATLYQLQEKFDQAEKLLTLVADQDRKTLGTNHPQYAVTLQNLAALNQRKGNRDAAVRMLEESRAIIGRTIGKENRTYSTLLGNLAALYQDLGRYSESEPLWLQCLELRANLFGKEHPDYYRALYGVAGYYFATADLVKAGPYFEEVVSGYQAQVRTFFNAMSDKEKGAFYARVRPVFEAYMDFAVQVHRKTGDTKMLERLYDVQLSTKAILLTSSNRVRDAILSGSNEELKKLFSSWQQKKEDIVHLYGAGKAERERSGVDLVRLQAEANELEKKLSLMSAEFNQQASGRNTRWTDVQAALKPGEAALEYIRIRKKFHADSVYYAALLVMPGKSAPDLAILPVGLKLETKWFRYYRNTVTHLYRDSLTLPRVWAPIAKKLTDIKRVYVSSDGVMNKINISGLYDSKAKNFVVDQVDIRLLSNTSELTQRTEAVVSREASIYGYPDFNLNGHKELPAGSLRNTGALSPGMAITDLPATEVEVRVVSGLLNSGQWKVSAFQGNQATEESLKKVKSPGILHVATHGFFKSDLSDEEIGSDSDDDAWQQNPLLRSGILLAGAGVASAQRTEDGILTAYEAMNLNLQGTDLVCLSACETGLGEVQNGEGVYGLQRSFLVAGAKSLMMSLWQVDDEATQQLMTDFYKGWTSGLSKGDAFRQAQQHMKEKYKDPFYWAAFVLIGS